MVRIKYSYYYEYLDFIIFIKGYNVFKTFLIAEMKMSPRNNLIRTRWKRDYILEQAQKKIEKEIHLVSNKTGVNPWVVLGIQY